MLAVALFANFLFLACVLGLALGRVAPGAPAKRLQFRLADCICIVISYGVMMLLFVGNDIAEIGFLMLLHALGFLIAADLLRSVVRPISDLTRAVLLSLFLVFFVLFFWFALPAWFFWRVTRENR